MTAAIVDGKFGQFCSDCLDGAKRQHHVGSAAHARQVDRDAHQLDMLQPWDAKGTPNREFIRNYPEESKEMFTQEELAEHG